MAASVPASPVTPTESINHECNYSDFESVHHVLSIIGFKKLMKITDTLQGSIWRSTDKSTSSVIKVTNKRLHENAQGVVDGVLYSIDENITTEHAILKYLNQQNDCPDTIVKCDGFYESNHFYYLAMEDGGGSLFSFVERAHALIKKGYIDIQHWKQLVKRILKQMIESIAYIHSKNICHFDISLENFVINDIHIRVQQDEGQKDKIMFDLNDVDVKLCDFGLSERFTTSRCTSNKDCGKTCYKSPEVFHSPSFDAKKNDIWGLGIAVFMMISGTAPWSVAKKSDDVFRFVLDNSLVNLLKRWNILCYFDNELLYLFPGIFQQESNRVSIDRLQQYAYQYM